MAERFASAAYFGPDCNDRAVIKRIGQFQAKGYRILGVTFRRVGYNRSFVPQWENFDLGTLEDGRYPKRTIILIRSFWRLFLRRGVFRDVAFFYARNLDNAVLALLARWVAGKNVPLVYEVLDIRPLCLARGLVGELFRRVERMVLRKCQLLVVSSPGYIHGYFEARLNYRGPWFLLENKMAPSPVTDASVRVTSTELSPNGTNGRWVIGWFGLLDCQESLNVLKMLALALPDRVEILLRGYADPTEVDVEDFCRQAADIPNMTFGGEYRNPDDLPAMYQVVDLVWDIDFVDSSNSRWLLSNKLYEAGFFVRPVLALRHSASGDFVTRHNLGWVFDDPIGENLKRFISNLTVENYLAKRETLAGTPVSLFVETDEIEQLCRIITGQAPRPDAST